MQPRSKLDRLRQILQSDLEALPDILAVPSLTLSDDDSIGGVPIPREETPRPKRAQDIHRKGSLLESDTKDRGFPVDKLDNLVSEFDSKFEIDHQQERRIVLVQQPEPDPNVERRFVLVKDAESPWSINENLPPPPAKLPVTTLTCGSLASPLQSFSPILPVSKYPYKFVNQCDSQRIASRFFDRGKFWNREWDLYYVWSYDGSQHLILISEEQLQTLLNEINREFPGVGLKITPYDREQGLAIKFPNHPRLTPRYLGRSSSKVQYDKMASNAPGYSFKIPTELHAPPPDERTLEAFKQMMEDAMELNKAKNKAKCAKRKEQRILQQQNMGKQLKRAQRYLGLRPKREDLLDPLHNPLLSWEDLQKAQQARYEAMRVPPINPDTPPPYPFDSSVVFISVDIEAYERSPRLITEVGISTLDVRDLISMAPGPNGSNWLAQIRTRHFRIREHSHLNNFEFVLGCADKFEFGTSEFISLCDAPAAIASCFKPPYSKPIPDLAGGDEKRNIILLGHDTNQDINYLQQLGYNPLNMSNLVEVLDTATMYRAWKRELNARSLGGILYEFDIPGWNLHNAGNDAHYTVQAMLAIVVCEACMRGEQASKMHDKQKIEKMTEATKNAAQKVHEDAEGWSSAEEGDDGGLPTKVKAEETKNPSVPPSRMNLDGTTSGGENGFGSPNDLGSGDGNAGRGRGHRGNWSDRGRGNNNRPRRGFGRGRGGESGTNHQAGPGRPDGNAMARRRWLRGRGDVATSQTAGQRGESGRRRAAMASPRRGGGGRWRGGGGESESESVTIDTGGREYSRDNPERQTGAHMDVERQMEASTQKGDFIG
ncbi:hypothetical protein K432DRAFT_408757 [Lepidopterella palustris CBS 459.81]|uniref:Gfd2/YDR514C-like C-terminal domain-containing protein n=1 Tax=Lepidopterella palustris CBS 459.81 TaxID=1314670 RepID=A0A8E2E1M5_9PEZI|nr:hypothetical protein K432DRAFT_408757 [Lepidopterella palustris CBS 459.81]